MLNLEHTHSVSKNTSRGVFLVENFELDFESYFKHESAHVNGQTSAFKLLYFR